MDTQAIMKDEYLRYFETHCIILGYKLNVKSTKSNNCTDYFLQTTIAYLSSANCFNRFDPTESIQQTIRSNASGIHSSNNDALRAASYL